MNHTLANLIPLATALAFAWSSAGCVAPVGPSGGLQLSDGGQIVDDSNQNIHWLADANFAAKQAFGVSGITASGSMDYATALLWVAAMNAYQGTGYLGHANWQLPTTPPNDSTCPFIGNSGNSFGPGCTGSAFGSLYTLGLGLQWPTPATLVPFNTVGPFQNLQPGIYWSSSNGGVNGYLTFSFSNGQSGANTGPNFLYALPMIPHAIGTPPSGTGLIPYLNGQAVYDSATGYTWLANANLPATQKFGLTGTTSDGLPLIASDGAMKIETATAPTGWIQGMNTANYLGQSDWQLPATSDDMAALFADLGFQPGDSVLTTTTATGLFQNIQPDLYWTCQRDMSGDSRSPCTTGLPAANYGWSFTFGSGFQGTTKEDKDLYVMVYYPQ